MSHKVVGPDTVGAQADGKIMPRDGLNGFGTVSRSQDERCAVWCTRGRLSGTEL
jgi:hypothetical protein